MFDFHWISLSNIGFVIVCIEYLSKWLYDKLIHCQNTISDCCCCSVADTCPRLNLGKCWMFTPILIGLVYGREIERNKNNKRENVKYVIRKKERDRKKQEK